MAGGSSGEDFHVFSQAEIDDVKKNIEAHGLNGILGFVNTKKNEWKKIPLAVALVGEAAVGKSTFINTIRGLTADDKGAAPVGTGDVTREPTKYPHPYNDELVFWDLPGIGTPRFPKDKSYLGRVGYSKYDFFLLLSDDRFSANDVWLAKEIEKLGKKYFFVRTKLEESMYSAQESDRSFSVSSVLDRIKQNCRDNFKAARLQDQNIYCIDNYEREKWDFNTLMDDILVCLPEQKRNAMVLSLSPLTKSVIKSKSKALRKRSYLMASISAAHGAGTAFIPIPLVGGGISVSLDIAIMLGEVHFYLKQYGLDDESLLELSNRTGTTLDYYKDALKDGSKLVSTRQTMKTVVLTMITSEVSEAAVKRGAVEVVKWIPVIGAVVGGAVNFATAIYFFDKIIKDLEKDAKTVIDAVVAKTSTEL